MTCTQNLSQSTKPVLSQQFYPIEVQFSSVQLLRHVQLFATPWTAARQSSLSITNTWSLLKLKYTESMMPPNHLILCRPLLLPPSIFPSIRVFSNESVLHISSTTYQLSDLGQATYTLCWNYSVFKPDSSFFLKLMKKTVFLHLLQIGKKCDEFWPVKYFQKRCLYSWTKIGMSGPYFLLPTIVALKAKRWGRGITNSEVLANLVP